MTNNPELQQPANQLRDALLDPRHPWDDYRFDPAENYLMPGYVSLEADVAAKDLDPLLKTRLAYEDMPAVNDIVSLSIARQYVDVGSDIGYPALTGENALAVSLFRHGTVEWDKADPSGTRRLVSGKFITALYFLSPLENLTDPSKSPTDIRVEVRDETETYRAMYAGSFIQQLFEAVPEDPTTGEADIDMIEQRLKEPGAILEIGHGEGTQTAEDAKQADQVNNAVAGMSADLQPLSASEIEALTTLVKKVSPSVSF